MAQLDVQPKRKGPIWIWLIFIILALGVLFLLYKGCNRSAPLKVDQSDTLAADTVVTNVAPVTTTQPNWNEVDFATPKASYAEITDTAIVVQGNQKYAIYSLDENVLFAPDSSIIKPTAEARLKQIAASLNKRFKNAAIGIYGHTDSAGVASYNKTLAARQAVAIKDWLVTNSGFAASMIFIKSVGETRPLLPNRTNNGQAQNRSIEIVAFADSTGN
ncbi:OmpA family protein [Mucilaginibacter sp.]|jgi:outer membrane protein OmpA-like peptidoglycan-associated protein|uniref:OmpA family protein n=1 Tax=Mucilaginibacter sp. TaxID=1882438 RepID=UPI0035622F77